MSSENSFNLSSSIGIKLETVGGKKFIAMGSSMGFLGFFELL